MGIFRILAWVLIALALAFLGADLVTTVETQEPTLRTAGEIAQAFFGVDPESLLEGAPGPLQAVLGTLLGWALWAQLGFVGGVLTLIFRPMD